MKCEWKTDELGKFITLKRGYDLPQQKRENGTIPVFSSSGISGCHSAAMIDAPGVITGRYGTIGNVFYSEKPFWPLNTTLYVEDFHGNDAKFIYYFLQTISWDKFTSASAVPGINRNTVHKEIVTLPDIKIQRKIAAFLSLLDDKIELNQRINNNLQQQAQAIYMSYFTDNNGCLADICQHTKEKTFVSQLTLDNYYSTENMLSEKGGAVQAANLPATAQTTRCGPGDVLVSNIRPYFKKIVYCSSEGGCSTDVLCFTPNRKNLSAYLFYTLYADKFFNHMVAGSKGTKMPRGDKQQIMTYPIYIPSNVELENYNSITQPILTKVEKNREENLRLTALRDTLLPKLMSGEIDL